jgi:Raf kinase inhibitor-like YbhB/YbcL family protein
MKFWSDSFKDGDMMPSEFAFGDIDPVNHVKLAGNRNPHFGWSGLPAGTKSLALICHDPDVPSRGNDVNQEGKTVPADLPRVDFFHWVLVDLSSRLNGITAGAFSNGVTAHGKAGPQTGQADFPEARHGLNDYTGWFAGDVNMGGDYYGYDGPCPPWNDSIEHRYIFTLYALDIERVPVDGKFTGPGVREAIAGHVLDQAQWTGRYTLNPALLK